MLAFGGIGTRFSPILGAVTFTIIDEILINFGQLRLVVYSALILALFLFLPRGLIPPVTSLWRRVRGLEGSGDAKSTESAAGNLEAVSGGSQSAE